MLQITNFLNKTLKYFRVQCPWKQPCTRFLFCASAKVYWLNVCLINAITVLFRRLNIAITKGDWELMSDCHLLDLFLSHFLSFNNLLLVALNGNKSSNGLGLSRDKQVYLLVAENYTATAQCVFTLKSTQLTLMSFMNW